MCTCTAEFKWSVLVSCLQKHHSEAFLCPPVYVVQHCAGSSPQLTPSCADCWKRNYAERPSFEQILEEVTTLEHSNFTSDEEFQVMQIMWQEEVQRKFVKHVSRPSWVLSFDRHLRHAPLSIGHSEWIRESIISSPPPTPLLLTSQAEEYNHLLKKQQGVQKDETNGSKQQEDRSGGTILQHKGGYSDEMKCELLKSADAL